MSRKHMPLYIGGGVALVLLLGLGYFLIAEKSAYAEKKEGVDSVRRKLERLTDRKPAFPSAVNVEITSRQLEIYRTYQEGLFDKMRAGQVPVGAVDQDRFRRLLEANLQKLVSDARANAVSIPVQFPFGFHRYVAGALPEPEEMPRLMSQLQGVAQLCTILYQSGISELLGVERTEFEKDALLAASMNMDDSMGRRRRRDEPSEEEKADPKALFTDSDGLFTKEHYVLNFRAKDEAQKKVLDRLAQGAPFTVVTKMTMTNPGRPLVPAPSPSGGSAVAQAAPAPVSSTGWQSAGARNTLAQETKENAPLPRDLRVIAGRELPDVRLEVDVYRFVEPEPMPEDEAMQTAAANGEESK